jgi:hypothetical protein
MKPPKAMVIKVKPYTARRLYYQGHRICISVDGYTTQDHAQQGIFPVSDSFFQKNVIYGLVLPEAEAQVIRQFQKEGLISIALAGFSGIFSLNFLIGYSLMPSLWLLVGFLILSYVSIHFWVKTFDAVQFKNNPYLQMLDQYKIPLKDEEE